MRISIPLISILSLFFGLACPFGRPFLQVGRLPQLERVILGVFTAHGRLSGIQDPRFDNLHYITFASFPQPTIESGTHKHPDLDIPLPLPFPFPSLHFLASLACIRCIVCMYGLFGTWRAARKIDSRNSHALKDLRHRFGRSYEVRLVDSILRSTMKHRMHLQVWAMLLLPRVILKDAHDEPAMPEGYTFPVRAALSHMHKLQIEDFVIIGREGRTK